MKIKIIDTDWIDTIILDFKNMTLYRQSDYNEMATFQIKNNILLIKWDKWENEYYAEYAFFIVIALSSFNHRLVIVPSSLSHSSSIHLTLTMYITCRMNKHCNSITANDCN